MRGGRGVNRRTWNLNRPFARVSVPLPKARARRARVGPAVVGGPGGPSKESDRPMAKGERKITVD